MSLPMPQVWPTVGLQGAAMPLLFGAEGSRSVSTPATLRTSGGVGHLRKAGSHHGSITNARTSESRIPATHTRQAQALRADPGSALGWCPVMTIAVYRIDPQTGAQTLVRAQHTVKPASVPDLSSEYPPCACPRHRGSESRLRTLLAEANRRSRGTL